MREKLSESDELDIAYHRRCKALCNSLGWILFGTSRDAGFSCFRRGTPTADIPHWILEDLETLVAKREEPKR